jgi:hypothetical protein
MPTHFLAAPLETEDQIYHIGSIRSTMMVDPKECTDVFLDNIIRPTFKSLSVDDQQAFKDYIKIEKEAER